VTGTISFCDSAAGARYLEWAASLPEAPRRSVVRRTRSDGQGLVEYGLIVGGIAVVALVTLVFFGDQVAQVLDFIGSLIDQATNA
jgi:Flp pilus assembly pilin Flp